MPWPKGKCGCFTVCALQAFQGLAAAQEQVQAAATSFLKSMGLTGSSARGPPPGAHGHHRREDSSSGAAGSSTVSTGAEGQEQKA